MHLKKVKKEIYREYKRLNKIISKVLKIKRDKSVERFLRRKDVDLKNQDLLSVFREIRKNERFTESSRSYLAYYKKRKESENFVATSYIVSRVIVMFLMTGDEQSLYEDAQGFENIFSRAYVKNKILEVTHLLVNGDKKEEIKNNKAVAF